MSDIRGIKVTVQNDSMPQKTFNETAKYYLVSQILNWNWTWMCPKDIDFLNLPLNSSKWLILSAAIYIKKETGDSAMMFITGTSPGGSTVKPDSEYGMSFSSAGIEQQ